ncbi:PCI domain-containing protein 2 [Oopsacas minuta]|uniref:CSN12-like protein n=1 Tax=Oopsacas minuta TaxID=111878 RepID=A0AAV7K977_9METZ|nr:PCI domain-containing protein 2 [Oopsacas minuta]
MHGIVLNLRIIAYKADKILSYEKKTKSGLLLEKVIEQLRELFRSCVQDSRQEGDTSRKSSILFLVNQLFKIYFKINQLHLCVPLIRTVEKFNIEENVTKADHVTYLYFLGRKKILDGEFKGAVGCMAKAFVECDKSQFKNKQLILIYLIPLRILNGVMPSPVLLEKYKLTQFSSLVEAVCTGNIKLFTQTTNSQQIFFIRSGIFLLVEKLRMIAYRNLFKRVWLLLGTSMLPIDAFVAALKLGDSEGEGADSDQAHCIIANLIHSDMVRGYISQQHQKVVVSKQNPFPSIV